MRPVAVNTVLDKSVTGDDFISNVGVQPVVCMIAYDNRWRTACTKNSRPSWLGRISETEVHGCWQDGEPVLIRGKKDFILPFDRNSIQRNCMVGVIV